MRMTAIHVQTERKRQVGSVRRAETYRPWAREQRLRGLIRPVPAAWVTTDTTQGEKCLFNWQNQMNLTADGRPLGECR